MARTALIVKSTRKMNTLTRARNLGLKIKNGTKVYNRCKNCGRKGAFMRKFEICRICFRQLASKGKIMGVKKSSW